MKKIILLLALALSFIGYAQQTKPQLTKQQSKTMLAHLGEQMRSYGITQVSAPDRYGYMAVVKDVDHCGIMDLNGELKLPLEYQNVYALDYGLFYVEKDSVGVLINTDFKEPILHAMPIDEGVGFFHGYCCLASAEGKFGLIDTLGRVVMPFCQDEVINATSIPNRALVYSEGQTKLCDFSGRTIAYTYLELDYREGMLPARMERSGRFGFIDTADHWVIEPQYDWANPFSDGMAAVADSARNWGYIDTSNRMAVPYRYDRTWPFESGMALAQRGDAWYRVDKSGNETLLRLQGRSGYILLGRSNDRLWWESPDYDTVVISDLQGSEVFFCLYAADDINYSNLTPVRRGKKWGLLNNDSYRLVAPCEYVYTDVLDQQDMGLVYSRDGKRTVIDTKHGNKKLISGYYDWIEPAGHDLFYATIWADGIGGFVDSYGNTTFSKEELKKIKAHRKTLKRDLKATIQYRNAPAQIDEEDSGADASVEMPLDSVFMLVEKDPEFPGGTDSLQTFIQRNLQYPAEALANKVEGRVYVQFVVETDGTLGNIRVLKDIGSDCGDEAVRLVEMMPKWTPARHGGKLVRCQFVLPVTFQITSDNH